MEVEYRAVYYVYIVTNEKKTDLVIDVTTNLENKLAELALLHNNSDCKYLLHYESYSEPLTCIEREMELSSFTRRKLWKLIAVKNPGRTFVVL